MNYGHPSILVRRPGSGAGGLLENGRLNGASNRLLKQTLNELLAVY